MDRALVEPDDGKTQTHVPLTKDTAVGHYRIVEKIGAGGMGEVYLAEDTKLKRQVALKFIPHHYAGDKDLRERFTREARAAAKLDHPNIIPVYEVGKYQNRPFIVMAHIEGLSLREVIKEGKLGIDDAIDHTKQILEGLHKAHEAGVVHRDIKPGNIIIDKDNRARLVDFGLAMVAGEKQLTKTGSTLGTIGYMSPEQVQGETTDHRSDLFSVGVVLYEMITGRTPFAAEHEAAVHYNIVNEEPEPLARFKSGVTAELQNVIDKALTKDPALRYQHADGMISDLKRAVTTDFATSTTRITTGRQRFRRTALLAAIPLAFILAALLFKSWSSIFGPPDDGVDAPRRLAVLYLQNRGSADDEYLCYGITEDLIVDLTRNGTIGVAPMRLVLEHKDSQSSL
ncbi:MAG: serine/threonine protein kinase, partial [Deltaproteobacteria bacterium]